MVIINSTHMYAYHWIHVLNSWSKNTIKMSRVVRTIHLSFHSISLDPCPPNPTLYFRIFGPSKTHFWSNFQLLNLVDATISICSGILESSWRVPHYLSEQSLNSNKAAALCDVCMYACRYVCINLPFQPHTKNLK